MKILSTFYLLRYFLQISIVVIFVLLKKLLKQKIQDDIVIYLISMFECNKLVGQKSREIEFACIYS